MGLSRRLVYFALTCLPAVAADLAPTGTLRAAFLSGNPVQGTVDLKTGAISGPVADIVKELARRAGVPYTITASSGAKDLIDRLNDHTYDIGLLAYEAERSRQVDFSGPYLLMGATYVVPASSRIKTVADADRTGVKIAAIDGNAPTIYLQQHLKNAKLVLWKTAPPYEEMIKMFASGEVDAYAGNRSRFVEAAGSYPALRVVDDNFTVLEQNIVVAKGDAVKLKIVDDFLKGGLSSGFLRDMLTRAKLVGVEAPKPDYVAAAALAARTPSGAGDVNSFANLNPLPPAAAGPAPRLPSGRIDFSGLWRPADVSLIEDISLGLPPGETIPLTPDALKIKQARLSTQDPEVNCLPTGVPRLAPYPWRIVDAGDRIFFLFEGNIHSYRQIFMDGRKHPDDPDPTWYGHSVGHWDGDTLVIDTAGFNDKFWFDFVGDPHTERLHTVERYTRPSLGTLLEEVTIDDPGAYTHPFTIHSSHRLLPGDELMEYICNENERDLRHVTGPAVRP